jgi:sugar phosphate isomerase/epimerase
LRIDQGRSVDLTYCTNIHAADGWPAVFANLRHYAPALKARLGPGTRFGVGLRLSARDVAELRSEYHLETFRAFLQDEGLYVALINGFPYGPFHGTAVKAAVYAPDWRDPARARYTLDLVEALSALLPPEMDGGISTAPISYKAWMGAGTDSDWQAVIRNIVSVARSLYQTRDERGLQIHLDIEPEPDCVIENTDEAIDFFEQRLLLDGGPLLAAAMGVSASAAERLLREHVRICFDCCHVSVEHEDPLTALKRLTSAGIGIGRVQLSSALRVDVPSDRAEATKIFHRLKPFADSTYLHQVICRHRDNRLVHAADLDDALASDMSGEWRVHFHVPLFEDEYDGLASTRQDVQRVIDEARQNPFTTHLEIETYTWEVLPAAIKLNLLDSIAREYEWVLGQWSGGARP